MSRNVGHLEFSYRAIGELLKLPKGHKVERVFDAPNNAREIVVVRVSGSKMPSVPEGGDIPVVSIKAPRD